MQSTSPEPLSEMRVGDLMTHGVVRALQASMTVGEAIEYLQRYGHEGYPVVDGQEVLGVLTQGVLGRAAHHQLGRTPVRDLVIGSSLTIGRDASISEARRLMLSHGIGQLPVVESDRMIGIITRTDLLRAWGREDRPRSRGSLADALRRQLAPATLQALEQVSETAVARDEGVYLVGGVPRDLLLDRLPEGPDQDLDVVVEGDAGGLAEAVCSRHGGTLRRHDRFGTATWAPVEDGPAIDLVTARSEYYAAPAVLPNVEPGSLHSDLVRRDFSINTLAVDLRPERFGRLIDRLGGLHDLDAGLIRALHPLSFVEDPTRILRALRFEQRFGFRLESGTEALARRAGPWLTRTTGTRIQAELRKSMTEPDPAAILARLADLGVLEAIAPGLRPGDASRLDRLPGRLARWEAETSLAVESPPVGDLARWRLMAWLSAAGKAGLRAAQRLDLPGRELDLIREAAGLLAASDQFADPGLSPSQLFARLDGRRAESVCLAWLMAEDAAPREAWWRFASELQRVEVGVDGQDLAALGLAPGPVYGRVLTAVRDARLDGEIEDREEALAMARRLVAELD